jgi:Zn-dependent protease
MNLVRWAWTCPWRLCGITVRLHLYLLLFLAADLLAFLAVSGILLGAAAFVAVDGALVALAVLHELGHCGAARHVGGQATVMVVWPLGGLAYADAPASVRAQTWAAAGGLAVNAALGVAVAGAVWLSGASWAMPVGEWHLLPAVGFGSAWLTRVFWLNAIMILFNLLPAIPFDGGRLVLCRLWPVLGLEAATRRLVAWSCASAIGLVIAGLVWREMYLLIVAWLVFVETQITAHIVRSRGGQDGGGDGGPGDRDRDPAVSASDRPEDDPPGWFERWRAQREWRRQLRQEAELERRQAEMDLLLEKVSSQGADALTRQERRALQRAVRRRRG